MNHRDDIVAGARREWFLKRPTIALALLLLSGLPAAAEVPKQDGWVYDFALYLWVPTTEGKLKYDIPGSGDDKLEVDPADILEDLQMAGMLGFHAQRNRWSVLLDAIYLDLADSKSSSVPLKIGRGLELDVGAGFELKGWIASLAGGYDVIQTERANLGVLFGTRYLSFDTDLALQIDGPLPPELPTEHYSQKSELLDGIVGVRGHYGRKWHWRYYLDLGTGSSDFTWQAMTGFGYRWRWGSVFVVYRYLSYDEGEDAFINDLSLHGPAVGVSFRF